MSNSRPALLIPWLCLALAGCTAPLKPPTSPTAAAHLARAHFVAADGAVLPVRAWLPKDEPPKAVILALHGFNDYSRAFALPGEYLGRHGIALYAYDQRGFGLAPGRGGWAGAEAYAADVAAVARQLRQRHGGTPLYLLGESMGGAVAMVAMTRNPPPEVDGLILSAPAVWARDTMPWYQRALLALASGVAPTLELTGAGLHVQASDNLDILRGLGRDPWVIKATRVDAIAGLADLMDTAQARADRLKTPLLVLYGEKDEIIPKEPIALMLGKLPKFSGTRVGLYPQGYHLLLRDLHAERVWHDIAAWIGDRGRPLPSGAESNGIPATGKAPGGG